MAADDDDSGKPGERGEAPKRPRAPVTIDLEAKVIEPKPEPAESAPASVAADPGSTGPTGPPTGAPAAAKPIESSGPPEEGAGARSAVFRFVIAGIVGALILLAGALTLQSTGLLPGSEDKAGTQALTQLSGLGDQIAALKERIAAVESATKTAQGLPEKVAGLEKEVAALGNRLDQLAATPSSANPPPGGKPATDMSAVLDELVARVDRLEGAAGPLANGASASDVAELGNRLATVESVVQALAGRVDTLAAKPNLAAENERVTRALAIGTLRQAAARGGPFVGEFGMVKALGVDPDAVGTLAPLAAKGAPSRSDLAAQFPAVADKIIAATATVDPNAGWLDRLLGHLSGLVSVRPIQPIAGKTPEAIVSRMAAAADAGDLARALAEREALPEPGRIVSAVWAAAASDRIAIDKLVNELALVAAQPASGN